MPKKKESKTFLVQTLNIDGDVVASTELPVGEGDMLVVHAPPDQTLEQLQNIHNAVCNCMSQTPSIITMPHGCRLEVVHKVG